jgi:hypothetical protein
MLARLLVPAAVVQAAAKVDKTRMMLAQNKRIRTLVKVSGTKLTMRRHDLNLPSNTSDALI